MERLEGHTSRRWVDRFGPCAGACGEPLLQGCHSLGEAHAAGLVHRDVKPAKCHVPAGARVDFVKVRDFGLVTRRGPRSAGEESLNAEGGFTGTRPTCLRRRRGRGADRRPADIYGLGCVATGCDRAARLRGRQRDAGRHRACADATGPPSGARAGRHEGLERVILRCLEKDPARGLRASPLCPRAPGLGLDGRGRRSARGDGGRASTGIPVRDGHGRRSRDLSRRAPVPDTANRIPA